MKEFIHTVIKSLNFKKPFIYRDLNIYPVFLNPHFRNDMLLFEDAINKRVLNLYEIRDSTENIIHFINSSNKDVFVIEGSSIGPRLNMRAFIVPKMSELKVSVSCIENNIWINEPERYEPNIELKDFMQNLQHSHNPLGLIITLRNFVVSGNIYGLPSLFSQNMESICINAATGALQTPLIWKDGLTIDGIYEEFNKATKTFCPAVGLGGEIPFWGKYTTGYVLIEGRRVIQIRFIDNRLVRETSLT